MDIISWIPALGITRLTLVLSLLIGPIMRVTMRIGCTWRPQVMAVRTRPLWVHWYTLYLSLGTVAINTHVWPSEHLGSFDSYLECGIRSELHVTSGVGAVSLSAVVAFRS